MSTLLLKLPWMVAAPAVVVVAGLFAALGFMYTGDYFHETCRNERNPLTGQFEPSNCGEGAKVARALGVNTPTPPPAATTTATASNPASSPSTSAPATTTTTATTTVTASATAASPTSTAANTPSSQPATSATPTITPTPVPPTPVPPTPTARPTQAAGVVARGSFQDGDPGHKGSGRVELQRLADGKLNAFLADFSVTNGPDLFVVLARDPGGSYGGGDLVLQPRLKANNGSQSYAIPDGTDLTQFGSVLIWCRQFNIVFAYATLEVQ